MLETSEDEIGWSYFLEQIGWSWTLVSPMHVIDSQLDLKSMATSKLDWLLAAVVWDAPGHGCLGEDVRC